MEKIQKLSELSNYLKDYRSMPIIICSNDKNILESAVSLNFTLSNELLKIRPNRRTVKMEACLSSVLSVLPDHPLIKDIDVVFNPEYKLDIIQMLVSINKNKPFKLIWPGRYENGKLVYAEEGYKDYKVYDISKYDIICFV